MLLRIGLAVALVVAAHWLIKAFLAWLRQRVMKLGERPSEAGETLRCPEWVPGIGERVFFATAVGFGLSGAVPGMFAWLALKMLTNWNSPLWKRDGRKEGEPVPIDNLRWAYSGLMAGLLSMFIALLAGLLLRPLFAHL